MSLIEKVTELFSLESEVPSAPKEQVDNSTVTEDSENIEEPENRFSLQTASLAQNCNGESIDIVQPTSFEEAQTIADKLKAGHLVVVNLTEVKRRLATKIIDFVSGTSYALDGNLEKVGEDIFLFTPKSVTISYGIKEDNDSDVENLSLVKEKERANASG
ncbi:cell division protein SepF [Natroniella sulfidigena]|uniref:cell division protein SepF n=1 Tax=Natroniella sulfidigena TaxID=723921 RepID=UPI00200A5E83|nr:cell division protein SepF [Natroniella sulfidigena]MCK8817714.1 cell division protein SepF [Natroniella sulfidigena]